MSISTKFGALAQHAQCAGVEFLRLEIAEEHAPGRAGGCRCASPVIGTSASGRRERVGPVEARHHAVDQPRIGETGR